MGWRGTLRALEAAERRAERDSQRRYRQLVRDQKEQVKWEARRQAAHEAEVYENHIDRLLSVHKESPEIWDWNKIYNTHPPVPPDRSAVKEDQAFARLNAFVPGFFDKLFGRAEKKRAAIEQAVEYARSQDEFAVLSLRRKIQPKLCATPASCSYRQLPARFRTYITNHHG
jgi:hypothetical protein